MDYFTLFIIVMVSLPAMSLIGIICKAVAAACRESAVRREKAARERDANEKRRQAQAAAAAQKEAEQAKKAAQTEEKRRVAAEKRKEQKRKAEERAAAIIAKEQERQRKEAEKIEAARQLAELKERALQAARELKALEAGKPLPERPETISPAPAQPAALPFRGNNTFAGQVVAFTGTLDGMTRAEAIKAVEANGGKAYADMTAATTILVVGNNPGKNKLDKADRWIGQVRKITQVDFMTKLHAPLTMTPEQFATAYCP